MLLAPVVWLALVQHRGVFPDGLQSPDTIQDREEGAPSEGERLEREAQRPGEAEAEERRPGGMRAPDRYFLAQRAYPLGAIPLERWRAAQVAAAEMRAASRGSAAWTFRGPTDIGGRVTDLVVDPNDPQIVYAAAAEGGVLRTTDGGQHWTPIFDDQPTLSIGALAIDPVDSRVIYVGTGEVNPGGGGVAYGGAGIFRSTDSGASWEPLGLEHTGAIGRIRIDPTDRNRIFVAALGLLWERSEERGVYRTTDGGETWERVLFVADDAGAVDLIQRPDDPDVLYAAIWQRLRQPESYDYGGPRCAVHRTTDGGETWSIVGGGLPAPNPNDGRIGLSLCAAQPNVMHAIYADRTGYFDGVYRSTNGGFNWTRTSDGSLAGVYASYGWWFGNVRTHPVDPNRIFVLGLDFYRSTNGGSSWTNVGTEMHVDHHAMDFGPGSNPVMYEGNDGGIYRSNDGGNAWTFLPDQPITQFYRVALVAGNPNALYGGAQDNGTVRTLSGQIDDYTNIFGGDGFGPLVSPANPNHIWAQYQYGGLGFSSNGGSSFVDATGGIGGSDRRNWNSPIAQDPTDPNRRYFGTNRLYRSVSNTSWTAVSPDLTGGPHSGNAGQVNGTLTTIGISPLDGNVLWTGSDDGHVQVSTNGGASWTDVSGSLPDRWITSVRPDPFLASGAYVTISGFRWNEPLPRVYRTTNRGVNWVSISSNLPDAPVNDLIADPDHPGWLYVATDVGMFQSFDGGESWSAMGTGLPNVVVTDLEWNAAERVLVAATYGRSFYSLDLDDVAAAPETVAESLGRMLPPSPNPVERGTWLRWEASSGAFSASVVEVFTASGRRIWSERLSSPGVNEVWWDRNDDQGRPVGAGIYFARVRGTEALPAVSITVL